MDVGERKRCGVRPSVGEIEKRRRPLVLVSPDGADMIAIVIPCYRVKHQILGVLSRIGPECKAIYVVDGLTHNEAIRSTIHSTDTHGFTEAVFGLTDLLGFGFAPRIARLHKQQLYAFRRTSDEGCLHSVATLRPASKSAAKVGIV